MVGLQGCSDSSRLPGVFLTCLRLPAPNHTSPILGLGGSILFLMPSRPASAAPRT